MYTVLIVILLVRSDNKNRISLLALGVTVNAASARERQASQAR